MAENINKLNEKLTFDMIVSKTRQYVNGEITTEEFGEWGNSIQMRMSLPIMLKMAILINLMTDYYYDTENTTQESLITKLYMEIFFHVYLGGYLDIVDIPAIEINYVNYDLLEPVFGPWIESFAGRDIAIMKEMIFNNVQFYNSKLVSNELASLDSKSISEQTKSNKELVEILQNNKELIAQLSSIAAIANPELSQVIDDIKKKALEETKAE